MKHQISSTVLASMAAACLLGACAHRPVPAPERPVLPAAWLHQAAVQTPDAAQNTSAWWRTYGQSSLNAAVAHALAHHGDLANAALKLRNAALRAEAAGAALAPSAQGSLSANANRPLSGTSTTRSFGANLSAAWEIDFWGKLATQTDMATFEQNATALDAEASAALLAASVVRQYWQLAAHSQRMSLAEASLAHAHHTLALIQAQYDAGAVSGLDLSHARQAAQNQALTLLSLRQQHTEMRHAFSLLLDMSPGQLPAGVQLPNALPAGAADLAMPQPGLPVDLLNRRPDLRAAEWRLRASLAHVQAERLAFYPALSLTGALGTASQSLTRILANPVASLGAGLSLPFLNLGELRRRPQIAQNDYEQAVIGYRQSVLKALQDVENALSAIATGREAVQHHAVLLAHARRTEELSEVRWRAGAVPLKNWLDAQEARRQTEQATVDAQLQLLLAQAGLHQALGDAAAPAP